MINHLALRAAQNKLVIAQFIGDSEMWMSGQQDVKKAMSYPLTNEKTGFLSRCLIVNLKEKKA